MDKKRQDHAEIPPAAARRAHGTPVPMPGGEHPAPKLGEILVAQGKITQEQLAVALELQKTSGRRLGEELVKAGFVKRAVVSRALRIQRRIVFGALTTLAASSIIPRCLITFTTPLTKSETASSCICPAPPASARIAGVPLSAAAA